MSDWWLFETCWLFNVLLSPIRQPGGKKLYYPRRRAPKKQMVSWNELDSMVNACMEDVGDEDEA